MIDDGTASGDDYFDAVYQDYEGQNPKRKLDHYLSVIEARKPVPEPDLLDIGFGRGAFLARVAERFPTWSLSGQDVRTSARQATESLVPSADLRVGSADERAFAESSFDVITAWDVLEHIPDIDATRRAVRSMLRPGSLFAFVVPVYDGVTGPIIRRLDHDPTHVHRRARSFWLDWADGLLAEIEWHGLYRYLVAGRIYVHIPTHRLREHTPAILVSGRLETHR